MKRLLIAFGIAFGALAIGCAPAEQPAEATPPPTPIVLADLAGSWAFGARDFETDSTLLFYKITATADAAGWMIELPDRKPMAVKVTVDADSVVTEVAPYESVLTKGLQVSTRSVLRMAGGRLSGLVTATYKTAQGDSTRMFRTDGTKVN